MNIRNIILFVFCFTATAQSANADTRSSALLERIWVQIRQYGAYEVSFAVTSPNMPSVNGRYVVSGDRYYISSGEVEVVCDGKIRYEISHPDKEVSVDKVDAKQKNILSNPVHAFDFVDGSFTHSYKGEETVRGKKCAVVDMKPSQKSSEFVTVVLYIDLSTGMPLSLRYTIDGQSYVDIYVERITEIKNADESQFKFSKAKYKGYEMIDFR